MSKNVNSHNPTAPQLKHALAGHPVDVSTLSTDEVQELVDALQRQKRVVQDQFCQSFLDSLSSHIAMLDETGTIVAVNAAWQQFASSNKLGLPDDGLGANYLATCDQAVGNDADQARAAAQGIHEVMANTRDLFELEYACHSPSEKRWFVMRVTRFKGEGPVRVIVSHENVTARKQAEFAQSASEDLLQQVITSINDHLYVIGVAPTGELIRPLYVSDNIERLTGYPKEAFFEDNTLWQHLIHPDDRPLARAQDARLRRGENSITEYRIVRADDAIVWVRDSARVQLEDGVPRTVYGVLSDVTDHKRAEEALLQREEQLRRITLNIADALVIVDAKGTIQFVNPVANTLLGRTEDELIGTPFGFPIATDPTELSIVRKNGAIIFAEMRATEITWEGHPAYLASLRDVTERRRAEHDLRQYAQEQAALYSITSAIAGVLDLDELVNIVLDEVLPVLGTTTGWVLLGDSGPARIAAWRGMPDQFDPETAYCGSIECPLFFALKSGSSTEIDLGTVTCPIREEHGDANPNHACIPLRAGNRLMGILNVQGNTPDDLQTRRELWLTISHQVGMALHNARLYQAARQVDRLRVLNELDAAITTSLNLDTVMETTLRQIAAALDTPLAVLMLLSSPASPGMTARRVFSLRRGWSTMPLDEQDFQRLQILLQQSGDPQAVLAFDGAQFSMFNGHANGPAQAWGVHGLLVPLWMGQEAFAVMALGGRPDDQPFTHEDRALVQAAANRASQAIDNASLYRASQDQSARLATLNTISAAAVSSLELATVLKQILNLTREALEADQGSILLLDADTQELIVTALAGEHVESLMNLRLALSEDIAGWVVQQRRGVRVDNVRLDPRFHDWIGTATGVETRSLICVPLVYHETVIGALEMFKVAENGFIDQDLALLDSVSPIGAMAIQNAQLFEATNTRANDLALLNEIGLSLTRTLDYSKVVQEALTLMQRLFQAESIALIRLDPDTNDLTFVRALVKGQPVEVPLHLPSGEGIASLVARYAQPVLVENVKVHPRWTEKVEAYLPAAAGALIAAPLQTPERVIGVIEVISEQPGTYLPDDLQTLRAIASTITVALENARLYEELKLLLREREQAHEQLVHSEKMIALGRLVASIAHEINNPLQAISGCLTLLKEELTGQQRPDKVNHYLFIVESEIDRVAGILRRMRDFHRPARAERQLTDIHIVLDGVLELAGKQLQHSHVEVVRQWPADLPVIQANAGHLKQVFLNLVLNAIDAMPQGGTLCITTDVDHTIDPAAVRIHFSDSGDGMPPEVLSHLFEPFFTTKESGSGLGLSITYRIIEEHGGHIKVTSEPGSGTTFIIYLPLNGATQQEDLR